MINNIQVLRAFAAINVVLYHVIGVSSSYSHQAGYLSLLQGWGANGVDIFFIISGFVMLYTQMDKRKSVWNFLKLRFVRIVPIYWLITAFIALLFLVVPDLFRETVVTPGWTAASFLFASQLVNAGPPIVHVGWTLEWEMLFYVIFSVTLLVSCWRKGFYSAALLVGATALMTQQYIVLEFVMGMVVAYQFSQKPSDRKTGLILFAVGFLLLLLSLIPGVYSLGWHRVVLWGVPAFLIVYGAVCAPQIKNAFLCHLGDASYSIYLVQVLAISAFYKLSSSFALNINSDVLAVLCLIFCIVAGLIMHRYIEKPMTSALRRIL